MNQEAVSQSLQEAGFTQYEADVYLTLVRFGSASAMGIAEESGVPKSRVYDVLRDLEADGLVETYKQDSLRARALDPESVIADLERRAESFSTTADELRERWETPELGEHEVTLVKRLETVLERAETFVRSADNEVQLAVTPEQFDRLRPVLHEAYGRGVFVEISLFPGERGRSISEERFDFEGVATDVCHRELSTPFVVLVDRSKICFAPQSGPRNQFGIVANNRPLAYVFHWYFQTSLWEPWEIVYTTRASEPPITYVNIRRCVVDVAPLYHEGAEITVTAEGFDTETGERRRIRGVVVDLVYTSSATDNRYLSLSDVAGQVTIFVDDGDGVHSLGGWYAQIEDFELRRLTIESVTFPGESG
ncbi:TrmB family transcriptional regulator [Halegenticoccus tardaugens]|uniref:TrmB family transcriptional regulator n=1 Tax=Halegenticoccus tardaugens TaxID=2071624 RepID=UPI00100B192F|nr:TrmB family transcriptional regulator [Halegenticoccus tardaugens]